MKKYTANYANTNHNFVIINLSEGRADAKYLPAIQILKNILQRGVPALLSKYLQDRLGRIHEREDFSKALPLIDNAKPVWDNTIKGGDDDFNPARKFFNELIEKYLPEYDFITRLILPEARINDITSIERKDFTESQVDFYFPQAFLVIEIDGAQHKDQIEKDKARDKHLKEYGIETVRIEAKDVEQENEQFSNGIEKIKNRLEKVKKYRQSEPDKGYFSIEDYCSAFKTPAVTNEPRYDYIKATAIIRFQILLLELLERGAINFDGKRDIVLIESDVADRGFAELAAEDLTEWFKRLFTLHKVSVPSRMFSIKKRGDAGISDNPVNVDFSVFKRYTEEDFPREFDDVIRVRGDYFDSHLEKNKQEKKGKPYIFVRSDYFEISTDTPHKYDLVLDDEARDVEALRYFLWNIFLQKSGIDYDDVKFRDGQLRIIASALMREDTIGVLPTGAGKSVCYQLAAMLNPSLTLVVAPIKALMKDQVDELSDAGVHRVADISSDDAAEEKDKKIADYQKGKYLFVIVSPERLQNESFRKALQHAYESRSIAYVVIDEAHCLSEWGHDFRISYLALVPTVKKYCPDAKLLGLTATASLKVMKDLQSEFGVDDNAIKTMENFTRDDLEFDVIAADPKGKESKLIKIIKNRFKEGAFINKEEQSKCGIVFTQTVNGAKGCYDISEKLTRAITDIKQQVAFFSGKQPKNYVTDDWKIKKIEFQTQFKNNNKTLMVATKAFGMGVNKNNIHYTLHYGIPGSMESLYQEAGRAGRNEKVFNRNNTAKALVVFTPEANTRSIDWLWNPGAQVGEIKKKMKSLVGDLNTNTFLLTSNLEPIDEEAKKIVACFRKYARREAKRVEIGTKEGHVEKHLYRLYQLGIVEEWLVEYSPEQYIVNFTDFNEGKSKAMLQETIRKYDKGFNIDEISSNNRYENLRPYLDLSFPEREIKILLHWIYDNIVYQRRQSLKTVYENCALFVDKKIGKEGFKKRIEDYFRVSNAIILLQEIGEKPGEYNRWIEALDTIEKEAEFEEVRGGLSRILESYRNNPGLDMISGLVRLYLDDYENPDGRNRFENALQSIPFDGSEQGERVLSKITQIGQRVSKKQKDKLVESVRKDNMGNERVLLRLSADLGDDKSTVALYEIFNERLTHIKGKVYGAFRKA